MRVGPESFLFLALLALATVGCDGNWTMVTAGLEPFAVVGRSKLGEWLVTEEARGVGFSSATVVKARRDRRIDQNGAVVGGPGGDVLLQIYFAAGYAQLRGMDTGSVARLTRVDLGLAAIDSRSGLCLAIGPSIGYLDLEGSRTDFLGLGGFCRLLSTLMFARRAGLQPYAEVHGWLGGDASGFQMASSLAIGANLAVCF